MICGPTLDPDYLRGLVIATLRAYGEQEKAAAELGGKVLQEWYETCQRERDALLAEVEQLRVQLAGCLVAAEGGKSEDAQQGVYGWSLAFEAPRTLRKEHDALLAENNRLKEHLYGINTILAGNRVVDIDGEVRDQTWRVNKLYALMTRADNIIHAITDPENQPPSGGLCLKFGLILSSRL